MKHVQKIIQQKQRRRFAIHKLLVMTVKITNHQLWETAVRIQRRAKKHPQKAEKKRYVKAQRLNSIRI